MTGRTAEATMRTCQHCGMRYAWRKSTSSCLKMTFCGSLCERSDLGFTIEGMLREQRVPVAREFRPIFPSWPIAA